MRCIVGLGNPEERYHKTRHNIGFLVADNIAESLNISFNKGKGEYFCASGKYRGRKLLLVKPVTYMNRSGIALRHVTGYYDIPPEDVLVIMDDIDLPFGTLRFRKRGSDGGNKGLRSIIEETGSDEISRLRIGIRNRETIANPSRYVLARFNRKESGLLGGLLEKSSESVRHWIMNGIESAMNDYNRHYDLNELKL